MLERVKKYRKNKIKRKIVDFSQKDYYLYYIANDINFSKFVKDKLKELNNDTKNIQNYTRKED